MKVVGGLVLAKEGAWDVTGCPNCPFAHAAEIKNDTILHQCILGNRLWLGAERPIVPPDACPLRQRPTEVFLSPAVRTPKRRGIRPPPS